MAGTFIVSLDFELFWGMLEVYQLEEYKDYVLGGRKAIPELLALFQKYGIHATWASVGFLFAENPEELKEYFPELRPAYTNKAMDPYAYLDTIAKEDYPCFFAPELLRRIAATPGQEIGSHTFCHFYCRESGQTTEQFAADMAAARAIGAAKGYDLKSVVLPRNQCEPEYTRVLRELGYTAYRGEENDWIHQKIKFRPLLRLLRLANVYLPLTGQGRYIPKNEGGICDVTGSRLYRTIFAPLAFAEGLKIRRIKRQMLHAAKTGQTFHLWWHPHNVGKRTEEHMDQLEEIFRYYLELKEQYGMQSLNMGEVAELLS